MGVKENIIDMLKSTGREGMDELIEELEYMGFFKAPASGANHMNKEGGLAEHSWNVCRIAMTLAAALGIEDDRMDSITIASLLHDLGKAGDYNQSYYIPNLLKTGQSTAKPWKRNPELLEKNHAVKSAIIANRFIDLTPDEEYAILHHDGLYERANYDIVGNETPLLMIIHWADMWSSRIIELEPKEEK